MDEGLRLVPEAASRHAERVDDLTLALLAVTAFFVLLIATLIVVFAIRYRRRHPDQRGLPMGALVWLEVAWTAGPLAIAMALFGWGAWLHVEGSRPPAGALEIYGVGKQWMWKFHHPDGPSEIGELHVPLGRPIQVTLASEDVIHSFYVPAFRTKMDVVPGRYTRVWFEPTLAGEFHLFCAEYCGAKHSAMTGRVVVLEPDRFAAWLDSRRSRESTIEAGKRLFSARGCAGCHAEADGPRGPARRALAGRDAESLREAIVDPDARRSGRWGPWMPTYAGRITEEEILQIGAWLDVPGGSP